MPPDFVSISVGEFRPLSIRNIGAGFSPRAQQPWLRRNTGAGASARTFWRFSYSTHALYGQTTDLFLACFLCPFFSEAMVFPVISLQLSEISSHAGVITALAASFGFFS
jgi:hypothetical protein